jgi:hypothetical protein
MKENSRSIIQVNSAILLQFLNLFHTHPSLQVASVVETVTGDDPSFVGVLGETVDVGLARHAVLEMAVAEGPRKVEFAIDAVLFALL